MKKIVSLLAAAALSAQMIAGTALPIAASNQTMQAPIRADIPSVVAENTDGDLLKTGSLDDKACVTEWSSTPLEKYQWVEDKNGGYFETGKLPNEFTGLIYDPIEEIPAGTYKITFYARTMYEAHITKMCLQVVDTEGSIVYVTGEERSRFMNVNLTNKWIKAEFYFELKAPLQHFIFRGSTPAQCRVPFCIDEVKLFSAKRVPNDMNFEIGTPVDLERVGECADSMEFLDENSWMKPWDLATESQYEIDGLMLNLDNTAHGVYQIRTEEEIIAWANQFKGTHITDIVMNIAESQCVYPTEVFFGWYGDMWKEHNQGGQIVAYPDAKVMWYDHYKTYNLDYLKTLSKALPEAGINMWMSIRMNDSHSRGAETSMLFTDYYFEHPEYRRVCYDTKLSKTSSFYIWNYAMPDVRHKYLALLNESLDRYDVYGYQFEWQRDIWLWAIGGEYAGLEILNDFMREADAIISIYEEKYGHEIKFGVHVAPDLQTNYDFGLDVMTWASEGIIDLVVPKGRWTTQCNETPVALWKSMLEPFGVEVAPDIENGIDNKHDANYHFDPTIETYAGTAALFFSQGADKIHLYNILVPMGHVFAEKDKKAEYDPSIPIPETPFAEKKGVIGWWLVFTTCGSYEKLMTLNRRVWPTFITERVLWKRIEDTLQMPVNVAVNRHSAFRIGMGDIPEGGKVYLKIASNVVAEDNVPIVYVNSELCKFVGIEESPSLDFTVNNVWCFELPESVYGDMWATAEVAATKRPGFTIDHAEIYIKAPTK